jgi:hypothetical protein
MDCTTDAAGQCWVEAKRIPSDVTSVSFTVDSMADSLYTYDATGNTDPDGDSDGTTITLSKP